MKHLGLFAAGVLFGTAGLKVLSSKDAKKVYAHTTAAALRAKKCVMKTVTNVRENAEDVYAEAKDINERRAEAEAAEAAAKAEEEQQNAEPEIELVDVLPGTKEGYGFGTQTEEPETESTPAATAVPEATLPPSKP